jgi:hypothetical protein
VVMTNNEALAASLATASDELVQAMLAGVALTVEATRGTPHMSDALAVQNVVVAEAARRNL